MVAAKYYQLVSVNFGLPPNKYFMSQEQFPVLATITLPRDKAMDNHIKTNKLSSILEALRYIY